MSQGIIHVEGEQIEEAKCNFKGKEVVCSPYEKEVVEINDFYMRVNDGSCSYCLNWAYVGEEYSIHIETLDERHGKYIDGVKISAKIISKGGELRHDFGQVTTEDGVYKNSITIPSMDWYAENILSVTAEYNGIEKTIEKEFDVFYKKGDAGGVYQIKQVIAKDAQIDGANSFTELDGAHGVSIFTIGSSTYAIVTAMNDAGVQIIDVSDPDNLVAKGAETDGADGFTELLSVVDVDTFAIGVKTYAITVSSLTEDGVQMIDISDPDNMVAKDAKTDGDSGGFDRLDGARDVETFVIDGSTYAIIASNDDNGVQIINVTDPANIVATDSETDNANGFTALSKANGVSVFTIGGSTYAIVASAGDHGVQIIDISDPTDIVAKDTLLDYLTGNMLLAASSVDTFAIGAKTYAIVASGDGAGDDGVQMIDISDPNNIVAKDMETDGVNDFTELDRPVDVDTFTCGAKTYAIVASTTDDGVQMIDISAPDNIVAIDAETDGVGGFDVLAGVYNVEAFEMNDKLYALVAAFTDDGVQMIEMPCGQS